MLFDFGMVLVNLGLWIMKKDQGSPGEQMFSAIYCGGWCVFWMALMFFDLTRNRPLF